MTPTQGQPEKGLTRDLWVSIAVTVLTVLVLAVYAVFLTSFGGEFFLAIRGSWVLMAGAALLVLGTVATVVLAVRSRRSGQFLGTWQGLQGRVLRTFLHVTWALALVGAAYGAYVVGRILALGALMAVPSAIIAILLLPFLGFAVVLIWWALRAVTSLRNDHPHLARGSLLVAGPIVLVLAGFLVLRATSDAQWTAGVDHEVLFAPGDQPTKAYRIPAMTVAGDTVLAFAESRQEAMSDLLDIDIVQRRSTDGGRTWSDIAVVAADGAHTVHSPTPVYDPKTQTVWLPYCIDYERLMMISSTDAGMTWSPPRELTDEVGLAPDTWCHNGPGNGIVLESGRLLVPTTLNEPRALFSDDHGATWQFGGPMGEGEEPQVFQRIDGAVCANIRSPRGEPRTVTCSTDQGQTWPPAGPDPHLLSAGTQASIMRYSGMDDGQRSRVLFSSPGQPYRAEMTLRLSYDDARTWPVSRVLWSGASGYSQLAVLPDGTILLAFEAGEHDLRESITLARVDLDWLTGGEEPAA